MPASAFFVWLLAAIVFSSSLVPRDSTTAVVNFSNKTGKPHHLASGILYGVPDQHNQIPQRFFENMGFRYLRAGGAQLPAPARGWIWGRNEYKNRFKSVLSNYRTAQEYNANFIFLIHDLWGADGTQNSSAPYPGDNGSWAFWNSYLNHVIHDMQKHHMTDKMIIDIWNEPDGGLFWPRSQQQYLQMWGLTYYRFRAVFGKRVLLSGPATIFEPLPSNTWWQEYLYFISANSSIPDQYAWHMELGGGDLLSAHGGLVALLSEYGLPTRQININEYAIFVEQVPAGSAWWISQLERIDALGLRGNWLSGYSLHDFMASLIGKPNGDTPEYNATEGGYWPNGDYQVYQYYNLNMTGYRVGTLPSPDLLLDTYSAVGNDGIARILTGVRLQTGTWSVQLNNLTALGLPSAGTLKIHTYSFPVAQDEHFGKVAHPVSLGSQGVVYSGDSVTIPVVQNDTTTAYAFEFATGSL